jgi:tRNA 2-thiouridine synthesizing protein E
MSDGELHIPGANPVPVDEKGYLRDYREWSPAVARTMAAADGVELTDDHWLVLEYFRSYYEQYEIEPPMRALVREVAERLGGDKGSSRYLYRLFPDGPGTQACRYAGLPRPVSCI